MELPELGLRHPQLVGTADGPLMIGNARHVRGIFEELMADIEMRINMVAQVDSVEFRTLGLRRYWIQRHIYICNWYIATLERRLEQ